MPATAWPLLAGAVLVTAAGFAGGYALADRLADARIAREQARRMECERQREADARAAAQQQTQRLAAALTAADASVAAALQQRDAAQAQSKEIARELAQSRALSGRACLSGRAVGLLNAHPAVGLRVPAAAASAAGAAASPAAHPGQTGPDESAAASDADLAAWALDAMILYQDCRARIDALRQWDADLHRTP